ncbi:alpha-L-fucosidase [Saccharobesus litoralis]|uniref:alpha-L-fucosidase n=1 Tax=Saccharobesus litoralis TaxID=2172099 RepID=A0A2S0VR32_9ALTE|nr:alpha-L-fucosidase [Saccharobesus litoralis]AWB66677.1 alpha-L-fucosidase [Saccharobesus litoralis]
MNKLNLTPLKLSIGLSLSLSVAGLIAGCSHLAPNTDAHATSGQQTTKVYLPTWQSTKTHKTPNWFLDAKFGIYFHWGPYSVPAHKTEWYSIWMYREGHPIRKYHEETYGSLDKFGYKDFIPMFTAEHFDPQEWAELFAKSGAKFAGPVSEHADGFAMWDSEITPWNAKDMGPKRDVVGEMAKAIRDQDMKFIATFHHQWKYAWYPTWDENTDASNPKYEKLYGPKVPKGTFVLANKPTNPLPDKAFNDDWLDRVKEVVDKYEPDLVYFDNKMDIISEQHRLDMLSYVYNAGVKQNRDVMVTYKGEDLAKGSAVLDLERSRMSEKKDFPWMTDDSIDWNSWTHIANPNYKTTNRLIDFLVDVVSKNGAVLLNITPTAQGVIPQQVRTRLLEMGEWLEQNGEAIYGTRTWHTYGEGPAKVVEGHLSEFKNKDNTEKDIRFTTKDGDLYAIVLDWPTEPVTIKALAKGKHKVSSVSLLGSDEKISWNQDADGLTIQVPKYQPGKHAFAFKLDI